jgi:lipopolysaccharide export system protein LptA
LVLVAGLVLVAALVVFLARGKLKNPLNLKDLPKKMGINVTADATGYTFDHSMGGHSRYRIHASKVAQYKDNHAILHDVKIELYGEDGQRTDLIEGAEFDYDQKGGSAKANGPVQITLMRPGVAPAIAPKASTANAAKDKAKPIAAVAAAAERGEIHVKTSGLVFDTKSGVATTAEHVDFSMVQGNGSSMGASYDSKQGFLVLDRAVELNTKRGGDTVQIHAQHAEFERATHLCRMHQATADYRGGVATAGDANVLFRDDGSAAHLDAMNGFNMVTATGGHIAAPTGAMDFDEHNQPRHGHLEGGVKMDSTRLAQDGAVQRKMRGDSPTAELDFTSKGLLRHVHLERGVEMQSQSVSDSGSASATGPSRVNRTWKSPLADIDFRDNGHGQAEPVRIHGVQGVVVTGESQRGDAAVVPSKLVADDLTGDFGPNSELKSMTGIGHASMEETSAVGTRQTSSGDRVDAQFIQPTSSPSHPVAKVAAKSAPKNGPVNSQSSAPSGAGNIQSAVLDGHVLLTQLPATKLGAATPAMLRAWGGHATYDGAADLLHLTQSPRVEDGALQLTADKIDVSHESGDAFAHGNVKATWLDNTSSTGQQGSGAGSASTAPKGDVSLGGKGPSHVIAAEAQLHQATGEATFRGHARLWQQANSVAAPVIILDRQKQTLVAHSADPAEPVKAVLLSAGGLEPGAAANKPASADVSKDTAPKKNQPSVISVRGGDLKYSDAERKAVMHAGALGTVIAETATATSFSDQVDLVLLPPGNHAGKDGGQAQVDRMTARGHVVVTSSGRRGTGEQLVYTGETGDYVLTGTSAAPPHMTDPTRGNVTGEALIFHSRDDSVSIEGGGGRTTTEATAPK